MTATLPEAEPCRTCHAPVIWAVTVNGKSIPVDEKPGPDGNMALEPRERASGLPGAAPPLARVVSANLRFGRTDLHTSHFVTCPQAAKWRKRRTS